MKEILFYETETGEKPVEQFLDSLDGRQAQKVIWVMKLIKEHEKVPTTYFKKLKATDDIWEVRAQLGNNTFRLLGFINDGNLIILTNGFQKKIQKTPKSEIELAEKRKKKYLERI